MMAWGFVLSQLGRSPKWVNNTRDDKVMSSGFWKSSFVERRRLIPATGFAEYHPTGRDEKGHKAVVWFSMTTTAPASPDASTSFSQSQVRHLIADGLERGGQRGVVLRVEGVLRL